MLYMQGDPASFISAKFSINLVREKLDIDRSVMVTILEMAANKITLI